MNRKFIGFQWHWSLDRFRMHSVLLAGNTIHYCRLISYMYTIIVLSLVLIVTSVSSALSPLRTSSHSRLFPNPRHGVENERLRSESMGRIVRPLHDCSTSWLVQRLHGVRCGWGPPWRGPGPVIVLLQNDDGEQPRACDQLCHANAHQDAAEGGIRSRWGGMHTLIFRHNSSLGHKFIHIQDRFRLNMNSFPT